MPHFPPDHCRRPARKESGKAEEVEGPPFSISHAPMPLPTSPPSDASRTMLVSANIGNIRGPSTPSGRLKVIAKALLTVTLVTLRGPA